MENYRLSNWRFDTSDGASLGLGFTAMSGGMVSLVDPGKNTHHFHYGGFGVGFSAGFSLTKIEIPETFVQNYTPSGSGSFASFPSNGAVYMTKAFKGKELIEADICGVAAYIELGISAVAGYGVTIMFLGLDQLLVLGNIVAPPFHLLDFAISQAPAVLIMRGSSMGPSVNGGVNALIGMLH